MSTHNSVIVVIGAGAHLAKPPRRFIAGADAMADLIDAGPPPEWPFDRIECANR